MGERKLLAIGVKKRSRKVAFTGTPKQYEKILFKLATATTRANKSQRTQARQQAERRRLWNS